MIKEIITKSDLETINLGYKLGSIIKDMNIVILLKGGLAAGKTTFTKGIAKGLNINEIIKSPTFNILKTYETNNNVLNHLDLYRLDSLGLDFDLYDYIDTNNGIVVIEWPEKVSELIPEKHLLIEIENKHDHRVFKFHKNHYSEVINKL